MGKTCVFGLAGLSFALSLTVGLQVHAAIPEAGDVIRQVQAAAGEEPGQGAKDGLGKDIDAMLAVRPDQPVEGQAKAWVDVFLKYEKTMVTEQFQRLLAALPGPDAWPALGQAIADMPAGEGRTVAIRRAVLGMLPTILLDDAEAQKVAFERLHAQFAEPGMVMMRDAFESQLAELEAYIGIEADNQESPVLKQFRQQFDNRYRSGEASLPDLLKHAGEASVQVLLMSLLDRRVIVEPTGPHATAKMAADMALQRVDTLPMAQWALTEVTDDVALYEALVAKFDKPAPAEPPAGGSTGLIGGIVRMMRSQPDHEQNWSEQYARASADAHYIQKLLELNRLDDAYNAMKNVIARSRATDEGIQSLEYRYAQNSLNPATAELLFNLVDRLLSEDPTLPLWRTYTQAGTLAKKDEQMLARIEGALASDVLDGPTKAALLEVRIAALLATSQVDAAVQQMTEFLANDNAPRDDRNRMAQ